MVARGSEVVGNRWRCPARCGWSRGHSRAPGLFCLQICLISRTMKSQIIPFFLVFFFSASLNAAESKIIAPGAALEKLAGGFVFTEGAACDDSGNVFFTDQPNDKILKWSVDGKLSTYMQPCGRANGLCFDRAGNLWACADEKNELWRIDKPSPLTPLPSD